MLKDILTELHANDAFLVATLVAAGRLDVNATPERLEAVKAEMRSELETAGVEPPAKAAPAVAPVAPVAPVAAAPAAKS